MMALPVARDRHGLSEPGLRPAGALPCKAARPRARGLAGACPVQRPAAGPLRATSSESATTWAWLRHCNLFNTVPGSAIMIRSIRGDSGTVGAVPVTSLAGPGSVTVFQLESLAQSFPAVEWHAAAAGGCARPQSSRASGKGAGRLPPGPGAPAAAQPMIIWGV